MITDAMAAQAVSAFEVAVVRDGQDKLEAFRNALDESGITAMIDARENQTGRDAELRLHVSRASDLLAGPAR